MRNEPIAPNGRASRPGRQLGSDPVFGFQLGLNIVQRLTQPCRFGFGKFPIHSASQIAHAIGMREAKNAESSRKVAVVRRRVSQAAMSRASRPLRRRWKESTETWYSAESTFMQSDLLPARWLGWHVVSFTTHNI